jgi:MFS family permease
LPTKPIPLLTTTPSLFRHPEFRQFLIARFCFIMPLRMVSVAMGWFIYKLTSDKLSVGIIGLAEVIPAVGIALYAGHVVDRSDKRGLLLRCAVAYLLTIALLCTVCSNWAATHLDKKWIARSVYACIFFTGVIRAFSGPGYNSIIAQIVPRASLTTAVTWSGAAWQTASVLGPLITGFLIAWQGVTAALIAVLVSVSCAIIALLFIAPKPILHSNSGQRAWDSVKEGIRFVLRTKEILSTMTLDLFAVFFGGAVALLPVYATDILKVDAHYFGLLNAAQSIGTILLLSFLAFRPIKKQQGKILLWSIGGFGLCMIGFGLSTHFWLSFALLLISGVLDGISVVVRSIVVQLFVPDEMRGRVASVNSIFINSSNELGQFESGLTAKWMGTVPAVVFGGCMTIGIVVFSWFKAPKLRKLEY